jgi:hypothetical protein
MAAWALRFSGGGETSRSLSGADRFVPKGDVRGCLEGAMLKSPPVLAGNTMTSCLVFGSGTGEPSGEMRLVLNDGWMGRVVERKHVTT